MEKKQQNNVFQSNSSYMGRSGNNSHLMPSEEITLKIIVIFEK